MARRGRYSCIDPRHPQAFAICDRGGEAVRHADLKREMQYAGGRLQWTGFLVCERHLDVPNPQLGGQRPPPADPRPIRNPRGPDGATTLHRGVLVMSMPVYDTLGNQVFDTAFDSIVDLSPPFVASEAVSDSKGAPLRDTFGDPIF